MESDLITRFTTLGHPQRLAIFRLLMRRYPDRLPAGEIAGVLDLRPSTLSAYLAALHRCGLVTQAREGTSLRYGIDMEGVRQVVDALVLDCCNGRVDLCPGLSLPQTGSAPMTQRPYRVLFLCTGNSARSIFAEALLKREGGARFEVHSAGTRPRSDLNPFAVEVLRQKGHDVSGLRAKSAAEYQAPGTAPFDFVFTVCDLAANEECPAWEGQPISGHWGLPDPVKAQVTVAQKSLAFQQAYGALQHRIRAFAALPVEALDRAALQQAVDRIGGAEAGAPA